MTDHADQFEAIRAALRLARSRVAHWESRCRVGGELCAACLIEEAEAALAAGESERRQLQAALDARPITREHAFRAAQNAVRNQGYAVALHGSQIKDLDLIAVPWKETALTAQDVAELIAKAIPGFIEKGSPEAMPNGRLSFTIRPNWGYGFDRWWIDLAVMPRECDWPGRAVLAGGGDATPPDPGPRGSSSSEAGSMPDTQEGIGEGWVFRPPYRFEVSEHGPVTIYDSVGVGWIARVKESLPFKKELAAAMVAGLMLAAGEGDSSPALSDANGIPFSTIHAPFDECGVCGSKASENATWSRTGGWTCLCCSESDYPEAAE